jgi:hypothetical protein
MKPEHHNSISSERNAVHLKAGQPVSPSGPGLKGPTLPLTADRTSAAHLIPRQGVQRPGGDLLQHKRAQGLGQSPMSAEGALPLPLSCFINKRLIVTEDGFDATDAKLDAETIPPPQASSGTQDVRRRKKGCGAWTVHGIALAGSRERYIRLNCKCWECDYCGPRRARRCRKSIANWAAKLGLNRFLTLTLDPKKLSGEDSTRYLRRTFAKLRSLLHREYGKAFSYICVLQYQKNGTAHLHILLNRFVDVEWLRTKWQAVGGGWNVWIEVVSIRKIVNYVSRYLSQELLLSAPKGSRRVTTSRDIRLFEKPTKDPVWRLIKAPIERIRKSFEAVLDDTFCEIDGLLTAFTVLANVA